MSVFDRLKVKVEELFGRAERVYGESHGDAAATMDGYAHELESEAEEEQLDHPHRHPDDDGLAGAR